MAVQVMQETIEDSAKILPSSFSFNFLVTFDLCDESIMNSVTKHKHMSLAMVIVFTMNGKKLAKAASRFICSKRMNGDAKTNGIRYWVFELEYCE